MKLKTLLKTIFVPNEGESAPEKILAINSKRVMEDENLELCPICQGTALNIGCLGLIPCAYCGAKGVIENKLPSKTNK